MYNSRSSVKNAKNLKTLRTGVGNVTMLYCSPDTYNSRYVAENTKKERNQLVEEPKNLENWELGWIIR